MMLNVSLILREFARRPPIDRPGLIDPDPEVAKLSPMPFRRAVSQAPPPQNAVPPRFR